MLQVSLLCVSLGDAVVKNLPASAGDLRDPGLILGSGRSPGAGNCNLLQYSCQGNTANRGAYSPWGHKRVGND